MEDSAKIRKMLGEAKSLETELSRLQEEIPKRSSELAELKKEKEDSLAELKAGRFCSECGRSATQLARANIDFATHVREVQGTTKRATPEQIAALEKSYDSRIDPLSTKLTTLQDDERQRKWKRQLLGSDVEVQRSFYHKNIDAEATLRGVEWSTEKLAFEKQLYDLRGSVDSAEIAARSAISHESEETAVLLAMNLGILQRQFADTLSRAESAQKRAEQDAAAFIRAATSDIASLSTYARTLTHPHVLPTGWVIGGGLLKTVSCPIYSIARFELTPSSQDVRALLEADRASGTPKSDARSPQSIKDLMEGK
jgi:hypothetical protein